MMIGLALAVGLAMTAVSMAFLVASHSVPAAWLGHDIVGHWASGSWWWVGVTTGT
jgi:hypothetical protein